MRHLGLAKVRGKFTNFDASVEVGADLASSTVRAEVDLASVDTGNTDRDVHLRSTDFFDVDAQPKMSFTSTSIDGEGDRFTLVGDLSLHGVTKPVAFDVEFFGTSVFPMDESTRAGFTATATISRKDFGIEFNVALGGDKYMISDKVNIELDVQLVAPSS